MALLEYGIAGLAPVATAVGQCAEVLDHGRAGTLVPAGSATELAQALAAYLRSPEDLWKIAAIFQARVIETHNPDRIAERVCALYEKVLSARAPTGRAAQANTVGAA